MSFVAANGVSQVMNDSPCSCLLKPRNQRVKWRSWLLKFFNANTHKEWCDGFSVHRQFTRSERLTLHLPLLSGILDIPSGWKSILGTEQSDHMEGRQYWSPSLSKLYMSVHLPLLWLSLITTGKKRWLPSGDSSSLIFVISRSNSPYGFFSNSVGNLYWIKSSIKLGQLVDVCGSLPWN